jgi:hypothetical protein
VFLSTNAFAVLNEIGACGLNPANSTRWITRALNASGFDYAVATPDHVAITKTPTINPTAKPHRRSTANMLHLKPWKIKPSPLRHETATATRHGGSPELPHSAIARPRQRKSQFIWLEI